MFSLFFFNLFVCSLFFFFNDTATTEIYTLSLHDALPISGPASTSRPCVCASRACAPCRRSEEHTSELQSHHDLVCRLLLEKKKNHHKPILFQQEKQIEHHHERQNTSQ